MSSKKRKIEVNTPAESAPDDVEPQATASDDLDDETQADEMPTEPIGDPVAEVSEDEQAQEEVASLEKQLEEAEARAADYLDSLQRERATFQNYKKRVERERTEQARTIAQNLLLKLLPTLDDFHRAMEAVPEGERDEWFQGIQLIQRKLAQFLANEGVTEIEAEGAEFDPNFHEAIGVDTESDAESGTVTTVLQRGYMHKDRVLRPAMVRVAE